MSEQLEYSKHKLKMESSRVYGGLFLLEAFLIVSDELIKQ